MVVEWLTRNWDKILMVVISVVTAVWAAARRFVSRIERTERELAELRLRQETLETKLSKLQSDGSILRDEIFDRLDKLQGKLDDIVELKIFVERSDVTLNTIQEDIRELKIDVKRLMRGD